MRAEELKQRMNRAGEEGMPFLFAVDFELNEGIFVEEPLKQERILYITPIGSNAMKVRRGEKALCRETEPLIPIPEKFERYSRRFDIIKKGLFRGESYLANLTVATPIATELSLHEIFSLSSAPYTLYVPERFVCFSPERFVRIENGIISTNPMKGTIDADIPNAEEIILADKKETAEHNTIVDLLRNDLGMVAGKVRVKRFRYTERLEVSNGALLQVSSEIEGDLPNNYRSHIGDIIFKMLPAGSICGAPKESTLALIREAEAGKRGFYTGVFGLFDGKRLDSAVMIRYIEKVHSPSGKPSLVFRSGGGITVESQAEMEYEEVIRKVYLPTNHKPSGNGSIQ